MLPLALLNPEAQELSWGSVLSPLLDSLSVGCLLSWTGSYFLVARHWLQAVSFHPFSSKSSMEKNLFFWLLKKNS